MKAMKNMAAAEYRILSFFYLLIYSMIEFYVCFLWLTRFAWSFL